MLGSVLFYVVIAVLIFGVQGKSVDLRRADRHP